jgi:hypothetical protein
MAVAAERQTTERDKAIVAAVTGATAKLEWLTNDRIEALLGGHGMLNIPVIAVADVVGDELLRGADIEVKFANLRRQPVDDVLAKAIRAAEDAGATPANAALLAAAVLYLAGAKPQVGIPAGNRKLGATARMIAGVDRCGVAAVPTGKMNNKISGFPAVLALNQALLEGRLSPISGGAVPQNVGGGPLYGHSALGEDIIFPAMAENGARIATQAMLAALAGAGMPPHPFTAALFGAAAILEIVHPDADVADEYGPYGKVTSAFVAGKAAAETAGLPEALHVRITGEELPTGRVIGDLGLILKDIGGPTVIGMMALDEIMAVFQEGIAGFSGGPLNPPLGHVCADAVVALKALLEEGATQESVAAALVAQRDTGSIDPEVALIAMNTVARKATQIRSGPVTETLILASEPTRAAALYRRAAKAYDDLADGKSLAEVVRELDEERQATVEARASAMFSGMLGKDVKVHVTRLAPGARRSSPLAAKWLAFDAHVDAEVTVDGETTVLEGFVHEIVPAVARGEREDVAWAVPLVAAVADELYLAANTIVNVTVPAAVAAAIGLMEPAEAAEAAERAAYVTAGIPGAKARAESAAAVAKQVMARAG